MFLLIFARKNKLDEFELSEHYFDDLYRNDVIIYVCLLY